MVPARIGLIGGMSWESTASYYRYLNESFVGGPSEWSKPDVTIDSIDFGSIVALQQRGDWTATGTILADSARRLVRAGSTVLAIAANTMHINLDAVRAAVDVPVVDVREEVARECRAMGQSSIALLGTKYLIEQSFYSDRLEELGVHCVRPTDEQVDRLQTIIFDELVRGVVNSDSAIYLRGVADECLARGAGVVGLCCTEFGMLMGENAEVPVIDSTRAHVRALLAEVR
jgi:aspartate racemase